MKKQTGKTRGVDQGILVLVLALMVFGLVAVSSASAVISYERFGNNNYYFFRQLIFMGAGFLAMFVFSKINYEFWKRWNRPLLLRAIVLLILVLVPGIGFKPGTSSRSWFRLGGFLLQPSEFAKLLFIFYLASWFERKKGAEENFWFGLFPIFLVAGVILGLIVVEPDIGTAVVFVAILIALLFASGVRFRYLLGLAVVGAGGFWILVKAAPYRAARILTFLDPSLDPRGIGYHINQALLAIGSGGFWGAGFGKSLQKHNYLPEPIGDSIFAVMAEELGFIRVTLLILAFAALIFLGLRLARQSPDKFAQLSVIGISSWIGIQVIINVGAISGLLPLTGITLPFVSYGGSSLLAICMAVGVILNVSKHRA